jgi:PD-(D/E)XK nuclease superfamily
VNTATPDIRPFVWSYSSLSCYLDVCPYQFAARYLDRRVEFVETPEIAWGNVVHKGLEERVRYTIPLPEPLKQWEPLVAPLIERGAVAEGQLGIDRNGKTCGFFDKGVWGRGKIDVSVVQRTTAYICDWKSGGSKYESPFELEIQALLLKAKHPDLTRIVGQYAWLKENRLGKIYDLSDVEDTWQKVGKAVEEIAGKQALGEWPKRKSGLCGYCPCTECENWYDAKARGR